jgi:hypothetical protein
MEVTSMRASQFSEPETFGKPRNIVIIPFTATGTIQMVHARAEHYDGEIEVWIRETHIRDAEVAILNHHHGEGTLFIRIDGTAAVYTGFGILDAIADLRRSPLMIRGGSMNGRASNVDFKIGDCVTLVPSAGKILQLIGADSCSRTAFNESRIN